MATDIKYTPLKTQSDLDPLIASIGDCKLALLGEASHGTSEYYTWRTAISKRLIKEKGFRFIAVEGDWPDCYLLNRYVKGYPDAPETVKEVLHTFERWPTWMWGNWEVAALLEWLKEYNSTQPEKRKVGFYGLDVYSLWQSLEQILDYLEEHDGAAVEAAKKAFRCFEPYQEDPQAYAWAASGLVGNDCADEVVALLRKVRTSATPFPGDPEAAFDAEQNALVAVNAERYYRAMIKGDASSWNVRDRHMMKTLDKLLAFHGEGAKAIVWEHNTHVGDARYTDMRREEMVNVGQLAREGHGRENVFIVGFGGYQGSVVAGSAWGAGMQKITVPEAQTGTWEKGLHLISTENKLLFSKDLREVPGMDHPIGHRAIGVVYNPKHERFGNYVPSVIPERYDAFLYFDQTHALHPLALHPDEHLKPDLYPWNF
jgi:erythromycin esterase